MVNRKKRLKQGIESLEYQLDLHDDKLKRAKEDDNLELADYYKKEIAAKRKYMEEKQRMLRKGG